jgi:hypothetical protein
VVPRTSANRHGSESDGARRPLKVRGPRRRRTVAAGWAGSRSSTHTSRQPCGWSRGLGRHGNAAAGWAEDSHGAPNTRSVRERGATGGARGRIGTEPAFAQCEELTLTAAQTRRVRRARPAIHVCFPASALRSPQKHVKAAQAAVSRNSPRASYVTDARATTTVFSFGAAGGPNDVAVLCIQQHSTGSAVRPV